MKEDVSSGRKEIDCSLHSNPILGEKPLAMQGIPEGFRAAGARGRERASTIAAGQTLRQIRALKIFVKETCVEAIASADRIYGVDLQRRANDTLVSTLCQSAFAAELYDDEGYEFRKLANRRLQIFRARRFARFTFVGQEHVNVAENIVQSAAPQIVWIVVGIKRNRESLGFKMLEKLADTRP